jgi:hypothetical protein
LLNNLDLKNSYFENKTNNLNNKVLTNSNELRYLTSLSGKGVNKNNLYQQVGFTVPLYENQKEVTRKYLLK